MKNLSITAMLIAAALSLGGCLHYPEFGNDSGAHWRIGTHRY